MFENGTFAVLGPDGKPALFPLENEQEYAIIKHCFTELKAKLAEQAAAQEGETKA